MYQNVNIIVYIWSPNLAIWAIAKIGGCTRLIIWLSHILLWWRSTKSHSLGRIMNTSLLAPGNPLPTAHRFTICSVRVKFTAVCTAAYCQGVWKLRALSTPHWSRNFEMNEWMKETFWASNFALKPKIFFKRPAYCYGKLDSGPSVATEANATRQSRCQYEYSHNRPVSQ